MRPGLTNYHVVVGEGTGFSAEAEKKGPKLADYRNGTSNSMVIVSAARGIPWSKPEDISLDALMAGYKEGNAPLGLAGGSEFVAGYGDGSVRSMPIATTIEQLKNLLLINNPK
jgi:hypothetical protein